MQGKLNVYEQSWDIKNGNKFCLFKSDQCEKNKGFWVLNMKVLLYCELYMLNGSYILNWKQFYTLKMYWNTS